MGIEDFMKNITNATVPELDMEYQKIQDEYQKKFGHKAPRAMMSSAITEDDIKKAMRICLESGEDQLMELLGITIREDVLY